MKLVKDYLPIGKRRSGAKLLRVGFITAHDTGNKNSTARNNADYYRRTYNDSYQSAHRFVDDVECIALVPDNEKAWHVIYDVVTDNKRFGDDANDISLSVEMCYFDDKARTLKSYENFVAVIVDWMKEHELSTKDVAGHFQLDPARRSDPVNAFKTIGKTWDEFLDDLDAELKPKPKPIAPQVIKPASSKKLGSLVTKQDVPAYARNKWGTQTGAVVKKGETRNVYAIKDGWYQLYSGEWLPSQSGANFTYTPAKKPEVVQAPPQTLKRLIVDGKQVGAYANQAGVIRGVTEALDTAKTIRIEDV